MVWVASKVLRKQLWAPGLVTLQLETVLTEFSPGQFVNIGLEIGGSRCKRSYSVASAVGKPCELYLAEVAEGQLTPRLFQCEAGMEVWLDTRPLGFFTLKHVPETKTLWLLATGTGLGPYIAFLRDDRIWKHAERVVLVHGVRVPEQLGYGDELRNLAEQRGLSFQYVPLVSRPGTSEMGAQYTGLTGRITEALRNGTLEKKVGLRLEANDNHVLLCGNPAMIEETQELLGERGMVKHRVRKPGQITFESYW